MVPIYNGQFRIVSPEVVLADIDAQVRSGAQHITFGDPDFFNGPTHAMRVVEPLHASNLSGAVTRHEVGCVVRGIRWLNKAIARVEGIEGGIDRQRIALVCH